MPSFNRFRTAAPLPLTPSIDPAEIAVLGMAALPPRGEPGGRPRVAIRAEDGEQDDAPDPAAVGGGSGRRPERSRKAPSPLAALVERLGQRLRRGALRVVDTIAASWRIGRSRALPSARYVSDHLFEHLPVPVWVEDECGRLTHHNRAFRALFQIEAWALTGRAVADLLPETPDSSQVETSLDTGPRRRDVIIGRSRIVHPAGIGAVTSRIGTITDITERKEIERRLHQLATTDGLTGVLNRRAFFAAIEQETERAERYGGKLSLLMIDLDHFKTVNDRHGHAAGDRALTLASQAIRAGLRDIDSLGRMGGEEFAVLLPQTALSGAIEVAERLRKAVAAIAVPVDPAPLTVQLTVSIGVAERLDGETECDRVLSRADAALYRAKDEGRNRIAVDCPHPSDCDQN